jgi:hypothetical protein
MLEIVSSIHAICDLTLGLGKALHDCYYSRRSDSLRRRRLPATSTLLLLRFRCRGLCPPSLTPPHSLASTAGGIAAHKRNSKCGAKWTPTKMTIMQGAPHAPLVGRVTAAFSAEALAARRPVGLGTTLQPGPILPAFRAGETPARPPVAGGDNECNSDRRPQGRALAAHIPANPTSWIGSNPSASRKVEIVPSRYRASEQCN